ncbi:ester cyclase [Chitinophaga vietnamensis]|uniref:ester cyclase n=1 Tax=Chitinophaga vietnamensis TaxID=2593957 RepID=UPI0013763044|nr:ester cyclase [Chitinophaga vietnamensis]
MRRMLLYLPLWLLVYACVQSPGKAAQNRKIVERYFTEVWNGGQLDVLDQLLAPQYINHTPSTPNPPVGPGGLKPIVAAIRRAFPDLHFEIKDMVVNDSMAVARLVMTGTQQDSLFNLPPTGKKITVNQINIEKIVNGRIAEHWRVTDDLTLMRQLGFVP